MKRELASVAASGGGVSDADSGEVWVSAVLAKFSDVGVFSLRDFLRSVVVINRKLVLVGHRRLHVATLEVMLAELDEMVFGPVVDV